MNKLKMTALAVPKFSTKAVDYPEFKTNFKEIVCSQHDETASLMRLKLEGLPPDLAKEVVTPGASLEDV